MINAFFIALIFTFVSEIADKTQLVILGLALRYKAYFQVFLGALLAHSFMDAIAIVLGYFFSFQIQTNMLKIIVGISFVLLGIYGLVKIYQRTRKMNLKNKQEKFIKNWVNVLQLVLNQTPRDIGIYLTNLKRLRHCPKI